MESNLTPVSPGDEEGQTAETLIPFNVRLGLILFGIYLLIYAVFVGLNALAPTVMASRVDALGGVNIAIVYGMALIAAAFFLAMVYMIFCKGQGSAEVGK